MMLTVSARDFRTNQKSYLDKAALGTEVLIMRRNQAFKLFRVSEDDTIMSRKDFLSNVEQAISEIRRGDSYSMKDGESLDDFMSRMERDGNV